MKYVILFPLILIVLVQCKKADSTPSSPNTTNIFDFEINPDNLIDTVTVGHLSTIYYGYFFSYDNFNRVKSIKYYDYFFNQPVNNQRTCTFSYSGSDILPQSLDVNWVNNLSSTVENFKIYFFYNQNKSKDKDSIIDLNNITKKAVRKYEYDMVFNFVNTKYYQNGNIIPAFKDSAYFNKSNCGTFRSEKINFQGGQMAAVNWSANFFDSWDTNINPFSRINIFPAMFMSNYLDYGNLTDGVTSKGNFIIDFTGVNNLKRLNIYTGSLGGPTKRNSMTSLTEDYDFKNRIVQKKFVDSLGNTFLEQKYVKYKYRN